MHLANIRAMTLTARDREAGLAWTWVHSWTQPADERLPVEFHVDLQLED